MLAGLSAVRWILRAIIVVTEWYITLLAEIYRTGFSPNQLELSIMIYLAHFPGLSCSKHWSRPWPHFSNQHWIRNLIKFGKIFTFTVEEATNDSTLDIKYNYKCMWVREILRRSSSQTSQHVNFVVNCCTELPAEKVFPREVCYKY